MADDMRIVLNGQAAFGESVLNALADRGDNVIAAICPPDKDGKRPDPVKTAAEKHGIPVLQFDRLRGRDAIDAVKALNADLGVMAFVTDIVSEEILSAPKLGTIQYHPSLLPEHRGPSSINWPIIQGKTRTGLTIFWPDAGLDTGPVLLQKEVEIEPDDTLGTLYFNKLFPIGVDAMLESVERVRNGDAPKIQQDESRVTYESWCTADDVVLDWSQPVAQIYNMIRGADPSPGANSTFNGDRVSFFAAARRDTSSGFTPGQVVETDADGFTVAAAGGELRIGRVQPEGSGKLPAAEWASAVSLKEGDAFGT